MFATNMKIKGEDLVKIKSIHEPNIVVIKKAVSESGRSRQFIENQELTFGIIIDLGIKVIVKDEKYSKFIDKCRMIDKSKNK